MKLTRGKIRRRIGQDLKAKYSIMHSREFWPEHGERRSGRTADLIVDVLEWLQDGPDRVGYVVGYNAKYTEQLLFQIKDCADRLGLDHRLLGGLPDYKYERHPYMYERNKLFFDHYNGQDA